MSSKSYLSLTQSISQFSIVIVSNNHLYEEQLGDYEKE